jgi:hypothetical protein
MRRDDRPVEEVRRDIERVMREHDRLGADGFGFSDFVRPEEYERRLHESREAMLSEDCCSQFERARARLERYQRSNIDRKMASALQHWTLTHANYVSNGMFIAAAIHLGSDFRGWLPCKE